jgi:hypothetical protein
MLLITKLYTILETPPPVIPHCRKQPGDTLSDGPCWLACLECWRSLAAVERALSSSEKQCGSFDAPVNSAVGSDMLPIVRDYSRASQFFLLRVSRERNSAWDARQCVQTARSVVRLPRPREAMYFVQSCLLNGSAEFFVWATMGSKDAG